MSYSIEAVNGCTKKIIFKFDTVDLSQQIGKAVKEKQKTVALKGFRKGKAPLDLIQKNYGFEIEMNALNHFVQDELYQAIEKENFRVVGQPQFENAKQYEAGKEFSFDAVVEIFPTVEIANFSHYEFAKESAVVLDEEVEQTIKAQLASKVQMVEVASTDATLEKGHTAVMNFQGVTESGEEPESMKGEEFVLEIGSGQFIPGFEDGMVGMKKGEKKDIDLTFPAEYHAQELQNAKVTFKVELLEIKEKIYPDVTDELAKENGFESVEDWKLKTKTRLTSQKEKQANEKLNSDVLEKLVTDNAFDVPQTMILQQESYLRNDLTQTLKSQGFNDAMVSQYFSKWAEDLSTKATFQVRSSLILDKLATEYKVESSEADLDNKIKETAALANIDEKQIRDYYSSNSQIKKNMLYAIREEKTFAKIIEQVKLK